jgi:hypothetical protein
MRDYLQRVPAPFPIQRENSQARSPDSDSEDPDQGEAPTNDDEPIFMGYDSDLESLADDESLTPGIREDSVDDGDEDPPAKRIRRQRPIRPLPIIIRRP